MIMAFYQGSSAIQMAIDLKRTARDKHVHNTEGINRCVSRAMSYWSSTIAYRLGPLSAADVKRFPTRVEY